MISDAKKKKIDDFVAGMKVNNAIAVEDQIAAIREQSVANAKAAKIELTPKMVALEQAVEDAKGKKDVVVGKKTKSSKTS